MKKTGEDSCQSWVILFACSWISFITSGLLYGPTGVLYVGYLDTRPCSAEKASWVTALTPAMSMLGGPLGAFLSTVLPVRAIIVLGILLGTIGTVAGYFTLNIYNLIIMYGVVNGIGSSLASTALAALINNAFKKYRERAMGIFSSVTPISGAIMPVFTQFLYDSYGLPGTFLMLGGIYLNAMIGAMLFMDTGMERLNHDAHPEDHRATKNSEESLQTLKHDQRSVDSVDSNATQETLLVNIDKGNENAKVVVVQKHPENFVQSIQLPNGYKSVKQYEDFVDRKESTATQETYLDIEEEDTKKVMVKNPRKPTITRPRTRTYSLSGTKKVQNILKSRGFHLSNVTLVINNFLNLLFSLITVDMGIQDGLSVHMAVHLMTIYAAGQLFGRLALGWVTEKNRVTRPVYFFWTHIMFGALCLSYNYVTGFGPFAALSLLAGIILGNLNPLTKVVYADYLTKSNMVLAMYMSYFLVGVLAVIRSALVGKVRDVYGNYQTVYYIMSALSVGTSLMWALEHCRIRKRAKQLIRKSCCF